MAENKASHQFMHPWERTRIRAGLTNYGHFSVPVQKFIQSLMQNICALIKFTPQCNFALCLFPSYFC